jgi:hypothetical protein
MVPWAWQIWQCPSLLFDFVFQGYRTFCPPNSMTSSQQGKSVLVRSLDQQLPSGQQPSATNPLPLVLEGQRSVLFEEYLLLSIPSILLQLLQSLVNLHDIQHFNLDIPLSSLIIPHIRRRIKRFAKKETDPWASRQ